MSSGFRRHYKLSLKYLIYGDNEKYCPDYDYSRLMDDLGFIFIREARIFDSVRGYSIRDVYRKYIDGKRRYYIIYYCR